jgi:DNA-binding transcriptional LysR family regulator
MDRFEAMRILLAAVDAGSLSAASRQLDIPLPTVSRRVAELEERLGARLLLRGTRSLSLTDAGRAFVAASRRIIEDVAEAERTAAGEFRAPQGELVISVPTVMGRTHVVPVVADFLAAYPGISMRVLFSDRKVSLLEEHIDVALRVGPLADSSMVATRIGLIREVVCASPAYLKRKGTPKAPADLAKHECVTYEGVYVTRNRWEFLAKGKALTVQVPSRLIVNSADAALEACIGGTGVARLLSYQIDMPVRSRKLVTLLDDFEPSPLSASLIYPSQRLVPQKLRAFLDFAIPRLRERLGS